MTPEMRASFDGRVVHEALATASMVRWMEWAARGLILDYLEPGEEGVGYELHVLHLAPAPVGAACRCRAVLTEVNGTRITAAIMVECNGRQVGEGTFTQVIVDNARFERRLKDGRLQRQNE